MNDRDRTTVLVDLHALVPEPPDGLLDWDGVTGRAARRRRTRAAVALGASVVLVAGVIAGGVDLARHRTSDAPAATATAKNGPVLFVDNAESTSGPNVFHLITARPNGTDRHIIVSGIGTAGLATLSADGREIAYVASIYPKASTSADDSKNSIWEMGVNGADNHRIYLCKQDCGSLAWSPDGQQLAFSDQSGISLVDLRGHAHLLCGKSCVSRADSPAWSPDGQRIAFSQNTAPDRTAAFPEARPSAIWSIGADGRNLKELTPRCVVSSIGTGPCVKDLLPAWSPDGASIAYWHVANGNLSAREPRPQGMFVMSRDGSDPHQELACSYTTIACNSSQAPQWSPDGRQMAGVVYRGSTPEVDVVNLAAGGVTRITNAVFLKYSGLGPVAWSPDGRQLEIQGDSDRGLGTIATVHPDGVVTWFHVKGWLHFAFELWAPASS